MTLWTPDGEHELGGDQTADTPTGVALTPEQQEQARAMAKELADARQAILEADPTDIIANHAIGIYELAALHITGDDPDLEAARLAVDTLGYIVEGLGSRLAESEPILREALHNIRLAFVQRVNAERSAATTTSPAAPAAGSDAEDSAAEGSTADE